MGLIVVVPISRLIVSIYVVWSKGIEASFVGIWPSFILKITTALYALELEY